jgi:hypothetical protein
VRYTVETGSAPSPFRIEVELWYQPIGYRWANNLKQYNRAPEPKRFTTYYDSMASSAGVIVARAEATR